MRNLTYNPTLYNMSDAVVFHQLNQWWLKNMTDLAAAVVVRPEMKRCVLYTITCQHGGHTTTDSPKLMGL